jgi:hypothetical protein
MAGLGLQATEWLPTGPGVGVFVTVGVLVAVGGTEVLVGVLVTVGVFVGVGVTALNVVVLLEGRLKLSPSKCAWSVIEPAEPGVNVVPHNFVVALPLGRLHGFVPKLPLPCVTLQVTVPDRLWVPLVVTVAEQLRGEPTVGVPVQLGLVVVVSVAANGPMPAVGVAVRVGFEFTAAATRGAVAAVDVGVEVEVPVIAVSVRAQSSRAGVLPPRGLPVCGVRVAVGTGVRVGAPLTWPMLLGLAVRLAVPVRVAVLVAEPALAGGTAGVLVGVEVGWGVLLTLVGACGVVLLVEVAPRVGVVVAWGATELDGLLVGVAASGSTDAAAKGVGDDR